MGFFFFFPYAKTNGLMGEASLVNHFRHRQNLELRICEEVFTNNYTVVLSKAYTDTNLATL